MAVLIGFLLCLWWVLWLVSPAELSTDRRQLIRGICWALHLLIFFCLTGFLWPQLRGQRGWKAWFLRCAPFFCLLPMPWTGIGYIAMLETDIIFPTRDPLARTAYYRRTSVRRLRQWRAIQAALRSRWRQKPWWQRWPPALDLEQTVEYSDVERRRLRLYQLKTLLLIVDGAALVWAFSAVVARLPAWESGVDRALQIVFHAAFTLAALGLLAQIPGLVAWLIRARKVMLLLDQHPYGRYLLFTQVAFLAGMTIGWLLVEESGDLFGWLLVKESRDLLTLLFLFAALCGIVSAFSLLPIGASSCRRDMHVTFLWPSLFLALTGMSAAMLLNKGINEVSMQLLRVGVWLTPLWAGLLGVTRAGWLLRPYGWRQLLSDQLPRRVRTSLVFLLLTAVLPLGGLAIPLWIYVHHRLGHGSHHSQR